MHFLLLVRKTKWLLERDRDHVKKAEKAGLGKTRDGRTSLTVKMGKTRDGTVRDIYVTDL